MKRLLILALPVILAACATKPSAVPVVDVAENAAERCVTNCEYAHQGQIRACILQPVTQGRSGTQFNQCITESYNTLGVCYSGCAEEVASE